MSEEDVAVLIERIDNLKEQFTVAQINAEKWREHFDRKLDERPCVNHSKLLSSVAIQLKGIWFLIGVLLTAAILEFLKR